MYKLNVIIILLINFMYVFRGISVNLRIDNGIYFLSALMIIFNFVFLLASLKNARVNCVTAFFFIGVLVFVYSILLNPLAVSLVGYIAFFANLLFWVLFFSKYKHKDLNDFIHFYLKVNIIFATVTAIFGIYQYFIDPSLMGFAIHDIYGSPELMESGRFVRRVTGLMGSPQNYSLYLATMTCLLIYANFKKKYKYIALLIMLLGGLLSGSRAYTAMLLLVIAIASGINVIKNSKNADVLAKRVILFISLLGILFVMLNLNFSNRTLGRMFVFISDWPALRIYYSYLESADLSSLLLGNGLGFNERLVAQFFKEEYYSIFGVYYSSFESYLLSLLMQTGLVGVIGFLWIYFQSLKKTLKRNFVIYYATLIGIFINISFTPSFNGLTMSFIIWPFILYPIYAKNGMNLNKHILKNNTADIDDPVKEGVAGRWI